MQFDSLISVLAPFECLNCSREGRLACATCRQTMPLADRRCYKCHEPGWSFRTCQACQPSVALDSVQPATLYNGLGKLLVLKLKFGRAQAAATEMADIMADRLGLDPDMSAYANLLITHVPTATSRVRQRGYDQSEVLARALSKRSGIPYRRLLLRTNQRRQVGSDKQQRRHQLERSFMAISRRRLHAQRILLVDDICTTGSTLEAAAGELIRAGAIRVDGMVFAKA